MSYSSHTRDGSELELQRLDRLNRHDRLRIHAPADKSSRSLSIDDDAMANGSSALHADRLRDGVESEQLDTRTVRKLDFILLPFLALLFLFNSLDKSNIGNAETANFTTDIGLDKEDLNTAVAVFYFFFVALQPVGAALGRKFGMAVWVPGCMSIWGVCTALHCWVRSKWQLILLRSVIGALEAGFYPTTVAYLSLFYTKFEFGRRLAVFYGQSAMAGALGGLLAWVVFSRYPSQPDQDVPTSGLKAWQVLFLIEGFITIILAVIGFFWLPHNARTAWFLRADEKRWAEERIRQDMGGSSVPSKWKTSLDTLQPDDGGPPEPDTEESHGLLNSERKDTAAQQTSNIVTDDRGLSRSDVISAILDWKIWMLLGCNILSAMPVTAFTVFMPLVLRQLADSAANANLLTVPPNLIGAAMLYGFTHWSDKTRIRISPILWGLGVLIAGLAALVLMPARWVLLRYAALCILMSGNFIASPLTVAWLSGNTPEAGKRSVLLGINGWGNLAGVFSSMLFQPHFGPTYRLPLSITLVLVVISFGGYALFRKILTRINGVRKRLVDSWDEVEIEAEKTRGAGPEPVRKYAMARSICNALGLGRRAQVWLLVDEGRRGDEKLTFQYGL